jgi:serine phosphatase RsbU (regulator of sigma subunit)
MEYSGEFQNTFLKKRVLTKNYFNKKKILKSESSLKNDKARIENKELRESILYAKRIQEGMMLKEKHLSRLFPQSFLFFQPKDIVSGDFYWFTKIDNKILIAVADCTGHGIPGALISVLGISLLNQIVIEEKNTDVSLILQRLDHKLEKAFGYSKDLVEEEKASYDGMDIIICAIDSELKKIEFSGALRPFYHISDKELIKHNGSRYPIGGLRIEKERIYERTLIEYKTGDRIFLSTDGYADQFGGTENRKFMVRNFKNEILKTSNLPIKKQHLELKKIHDEWRGINNFQTDDILVIGIEL